MLSLKPNLASGWSLGTQGATVATEQSGAELRHLVGGKADSVLNSHGVPSCHFKVGP